MSTTTTTTTTTSLQHISGVSAHSNVKGRSPFFRKPIPPQQPGDDCCEDHEATRRAFPSSSAARGKPPNVRRRTTNGLPPTYSVVEQTCSDAAVDESSERPLPSPLQVTVPTQEHFEIDDNNSQFDEDCDTDTDHPPSEGLERHLSLLDLIAIGVGGTIGSGLFVLAGLVAHSYAGPSTVVSWAISGFAACLSGCCYAELAARIPHSGGTYAYSYVAMGELPAVLAAVCLSLEYLASAAAVARSWGDKCVEWMQEEFGDRHWIHDILGTHGTFSPLALVISSSVVVLLLNGVKESKQATNFFTGLKVGVVALMVAVGLFHIQPSNWRPFIPAEFGVAGMVRGASGTFFGYIGYDQVSCIAGEAINPKKNLPIAIMSTLVLVSCIYMLATLVLTGMQPYQDISTVSGFPIALYSVGARVAGQITAFGEILTLPIVVLIGALAQPRLQFAMAEDGLLPPFFRKLDHKGNLWNGTLFSGIWLIIIATFVPFQHLNDVISCAVLSALSMTNTSLIMLWHEPLDPESMLGIQLLTVFHLEAMITGVAIARFLDSAIGILVTMIGAICMVITMCLISKWCPRSDVFGGHREHHYQSSLKTDDGYYRTPFVPYLPCLGIFVNWCLIAQLDLFGIVGLLILFALAILYYFLYARHHVVGHHAVPDHPGRHTSQKEFKDRYVDTKSIFSHSLSMSELDERPSLQHRAMAFEEHST